jgi:hypothetical protein
MTMLTIEADGPLNENLSFRPLQRAIRGRFDWQRCGDPEALRLGMAFGGLPIPGQRIAFDAEKKTATIVEPLHDPEHAALAEKIKARGYKLPPAREYIEGCDPDTWAFWISRAIESGLAKLVAGKLPEFDPDKARRDFIFAPPKPGTTDKLTDALNNLASAQAAQTAVLEKLVMMLAKK